MQSLKCKPGDLALVVEPSYFKSNRSGILVDVLRLAPIGDFSHDGTKFKRRSGDPAWVVRNSNNGSIPVLAQDMYGPDAIEEAPYALIYDCFLYPLPGEEGSLDIDAARPLELVKG